MLLLFRTLFYVTPSTLRDEVRLSEYRSWRELDRWYKFNHLGLINHWLIFFLLLFYYKNVCQSSKVRKVHLPKVSVFYGHTVDPKDCQVVTLADQLDTIKRSQNGKRSAGTASIALSASILAGSLFYLILRQLVTGFHL